MWKTLSLLLKLWFSFLRFEWFLTECSVLTDNYSFNVLSTDNSSSLEAIFGENIANLLSVDNKSAEWEDHIDNGNSFCGSFSSYGPSEGTVYYISDMFEVYCECYEDMDPRRTINEACPEISVQNGQTYLRQWSNRTVRGRNSCKTYSGYRVIYEPSSGSEYLVVECTVPGTSWTAFYNAEIQIKEDSDSPKKDYHFVDNNHLMFYVILACITFMVILYLSLGIYCKRRGIVSRRSLGLLAPRRISTAANQQRVTTVSQRVPQDRPPSYHEAMLRHQESGELPPSYSNACALMAAALLSKKQSRDVSNSEESSHANSSTTVTHPEVAQNNTS